ncbi:MAG: hypothetical protein QME51_06745 [Planctomycetota bacterium]|nr:hypothetical protein [Planctomycetota bacterium]MDI6788050.1 hypothetical protein [Planctomycetota bacterium]
MINISLLNEIREKAQEFWQSEVKKDSFIQIAQGKEIGHRIADPVDDKTTGWLAINYRACYERDKDGNKHPRSMGDIWLEDKGIYHPVNVKSSVSDTNGQPNLVSLKKLMDSLLLQQIDSYYLLIIKFEIEKTIKCRVYFVDLLDHLDYVTWDSGPGQIMLKANDFFGAMIKGISPVKRTIRQKVEKLMKLLEDGERRLLENRKRGLKIFRKRFNEYILENTHIVTSESQKPLNLR